MKFFDWLLARRKRVLLDRIAREICSTNEGIRFAREFLYQGGNRNYGNKKQNEKYTIYEPLRIFFEYSD